MRVEISSVLTIPKDRITAETAESIKARYTYLNPEYSKKRRMGVTTFGVPKHLSLCVDHGDRLILPRGLINDVAGLWPVRQWEDRSLAAPRTLPSCSGIQNRPYQTAFVDDLGAFNQGMGVAPTGSGKTVMGNMLLSRRGQCALVLVHTNDLFNQWVSAFKRIMGLSARDIGAIKSGTFKARAVTVGMMQTVAERFDDNMAGYFGLVLVDECHHVPCSTLRAVLDRMPARYRYGLTATPFRTDGLDFMLTAMLGPIRHEITDAELHAIGAVIKPRVQVVPMGSNFPEIKDYNDMLSKLVDHPGRNDVIRAKVAAACREGHFCLVLSNRVGHAHELHKGFAARYLDFKAVVATGSSKKAEREQALADVRDGRAQVLFATKIADEGLDLPRLDRLFLATPSRAHGRVKQQIGRITRPFPGKKDAVVYDFVDEFIPLAVSQFRSRKRQAYRGLEIHEPGVLDVA